MHGASIFRTDERFRFCWQPASFPPALSFLLFAFRQSNLYIFGVRVSSECPEKKDRHKARKNEKDKQRNHAFCFGFFRIDRFFILPPKMEENRKTEGKKEIYEEIKKKKDTAKENSKQILMICL